jgi:hypothetical protein
MKRRRGCTGYRFPDAPESLGQRDKTRANSVTSKCSSRMLCVHMHSLATTQIQAETFPVGVALRLRWIRVEHAIVNYPWKRAKLYQLMNRGEIKSFSLKEKGKTRGIRLIDKDSIDAYLER